MHGDASNYSTAIAATAVSKSNDTYHDASLGDCSPQSTIPYDLQLNEKLRQLDKYTSASSLAFWVSFDVLDFQQSAMQKKFVTSADGQVFRLRTTISFVSL